MKALPFHRFHIDKWSVISYWIFVANGPFALININDRRGSPSFHLGVLKRFLMIKETNGKERDLFLFAVQNRGVLAIYS